MPAPAAPDLPPLSPKLPAPVLELERSLTRFLNKKQLALIHRAWLLGARAHEGQTRASGEPYIFHPVAVASILGRMQMDPETIAAAILHDVIEDTEITKGQVAEQFGDAVAELVDGVTKLDKMQFSTRQEATAASFRKMLLAMARDIRVILIKLADRLHNMRTLGAMKLQSRRRIARETLDIYAPLAERLGMHEVKRELEDQSFKSLYPWRYAVLGERLTKARSHRSENLARIEKSIRARMRKEKIDCQISGRVKAPYSIYQKMRSKDRSFDELTDLCGFRLIVPEVSDCYRALGVVHALYKPLSALFKDYIAIPKANGYQSLHTVLFGPFGDKIEVQIRTPAMDRTAEQGIAAHWAYKADAEQVTATSRARKWLFGLLDMQRESGDSIEFLEHVKVDLFPDEIFVFTRDGEIMELPRNSTALDFAYGVHTDIGNHAVRARIDGNTMPLRTVLVSGQKVEIITAPSASPNPEWLLSVVTGKARAGIRHYLKGLEYEDAVELGHRMLDKALVQLGSTLDRFNDTQIAKLLEDYHAERLEELLSDIALGNRMPLVVARHMIAGQHDAEHPGEPGEDEALRLSGEEGQVVTYGNCCHPIPGDPIIGFLSAGKGLVIHRKNCRNLPLLRKSPDRWLEVCWDVNPTGQFSVALRANVHNEPGVLATVAAAIARGGCNIEHVEYQERDESSATLVFQITVADRNHLARAMRRVRMCGVVMSVHRTAG